MATPIHFPEANWGLTKPEGWTDEQCRELPVFTDGRNCISCWEPSAEELAALNAGGKIWLGVVSGTTQPPVFVQVECPIVYSSGPLPEPLPKLTPEYRRALARIAVLLPGLNGQPASEESVCEHYAALTEAAEQGGQPAVVKYLQPYEAYLTPQE